MIDGFDTHTATFYREQKVGTEEDAYGEPEPVFDWVVSFEDVPVRVEQQNAEYVRDVYGEWPQEVYRLFVDPLQVGDTEAGYGDSYGSYYGGLLREYQIGISPNDRVELAGVTGTFSIQPPNIRGLSDIPEVVQLEVVRIGE